MKKELISGVNLKSVLFLLILVLVAVVSYFYFFSENSKDKKDSSLTSYTNEPERDADVYGMITSVRGNKITVLKFDPSLLPGDSDEESEAIEEDGDSNIISLGQTSTMPSGGGPGEGGGGFGGMFGSSSSTRQDKLDELKTSSIGSETIEVPVGIPVFIESEEDDSSGNLRDLTSDTIVIIWLEDIEDISQEDSEEYGIDSNSEEVENRVAVYVKVTGKMDMES